MVHSNFEPIYRECRHLYIVGNGFDLHHKLKTSFDDFGAFLRDHESDIYDWLLKTCDLPQLSSEASEPKTNWSNFESTLADFQAEEIWERVKDYMD